MFLIQLKNFLMCKLKWTSNAKEDLLSIIDYIKQDNPQSARKVYKQI